MSRMSVGFEKRSNGLFLRARHTPSPILSAKYLERDRPTSFNHAIGAFQRTSAALVALVNGHLGIEHA